MKFYSEAQSSQKILKTLLDANADGHEIKKLIHNNVNTFSASAWKVLAAHQNENGQFLNAKYILNHDKIVKQLGEKDLLSLASQHLALSIIIAGSPSIKEHVTPSLFSKLETIRNNMSEQTMQLGDTATKM